MHAEFFKQREVNVRQRCRICVVDVSSALVTSGDDKRQIRVIVHVRVTKAAANDVNRMIQKRAVTIGRGFQFSEEVCEERYVKRVDLRELRQLFRIVRVMGYRMVRLEYSDLRIGPGAGFARHLKGGDACDVGLESE